MKMTRIPVREDLALELYRLGKKLDMPVPVLLEEIIRKDLKERRNSNGLDYQGHTADCPF